MANPYSYDLRQKVIQAIELDGMKKVKPHRCSGSVATRSYLWLKRRNETGDYQQAPRQPPGNGHKITGWEKFRAFAAQHGDKTQTQMAKLWEEDISARTQSASLKENQVHAKKKTYGYRERSGGQTTGIPRAVGDQGA